MKNQAPEAAGSGMLSLTYWLCQVLGWGAYVTLGLYFAQRQAYYNERVLLGYLLFWVYSIALSHGLGRLIQKREWLALRIGGIVVRLTIAGLLLAFVQLILIVAVQYVLSGPDSLRGQPYLFYVLYGNLCFAAAMWIVLFVGMDAILRAHRSKRLAADLEHSYNAARLKSLEEQVNPHFLFNCLNSIRGMIAEDPVQAQDMVTCLANLLRHSLQHSLVSTLSLAEELAIVKDYLALERVRFDERLRISYELAPESLSCRVPPMSLLTLVENALKHGIAHLQEGGEVLLRSEIDGGLLRLSVSNTGSLRTAKSGGTQVGLANLRERLRILHGQKAGLVLREISGPAVEAVVTLPYSTLESSVTLKP